MSKIGDYYLKEREQRDKQTVADFANELKKSPVSLLAQLHEAGVQKNSEIDRITESDKQALLEFLISRQGTETSRKRITLVPSPREIEELKAVAEQENGAEWACLELLACQVIAGNTIDPKMQTVINLIVAKAVFSQSLPMKKLGRPRLQETEDLGREVAQDYWDMRDAGATYSEAVSKLANAVHKDERYVMRLVEKHKKFVGLTLEDRERKRKSDQTMRDLYRLFPTGDSSTLPMFGKPWPNFTPDDYIEYLDELIGRVVVSKTPTGIKEPPFIASD